MSDDAGRKTTSPDNAIELAPRANLRKSIAREYVETIVVFVLILVFARSFIFIQSKIPTESMLDTLLVGDYILVNRALYGAPGDDPIPWIGQDTIERGDVVVFRKPDDPDVDYVKRVVGLPGDVIEIRQNQTYVNGEPLDEPYIVDGNFEQTRFFGPRTVPADHFFMMGDNRDNSSDSRVWGTVPRSLVKGKAFFIWYSYREEKNDHLNVGVNRLISMGKKVVRFPWRTRWDRIFSKIE
jgi:signal peptidase I